MEDNAEFVVMQENAEAEKEEPPDPGPRPARPWRVAVIANVRGKTPVGENAPHDAGAEFDKIETIQAVQKSIESHGHSTVFLAADTGLPLHLMRENPDICFNFAEGLGGDAREAQVPALLEMLHIPYTASRVLTNAVGLDKTLTKRIWRDCGLPTARFQQFDTGDETIDPGLSFPMFVKPAREGTGMGMGSESITHNETELRRQVKWVIENYRQPALVEEYLSGREFTVAVLGRQDAGLYSQHPEWYGSDGFHRFPVLEVDHHSAATPGVYGHHLKTLGFEDDGAARFLCPASIETNLQHQLQELAIQAHVTLGA
ncbi:MAG: hypothetical protein LWX83_16845, partial [Anaerolineae bacterium]|nr:hypothetical protein [Anaerolineae bacterium]